MLLFTRDERIRAKINDIKIHKTNCKSKNDSCEVIKKKQNSQIRYLRNIIDQHIK